MSNIHTITGTNQYDEAISHICFLSDVNKLYDTALGTYDLDLTLTIAQHAQKVHPSISHTRTSGTHYQSNRTLANTFLSSRVSKKWITFGADS